MNITRRQLRQQFDRAVRLGWLQHFEAASKTTNGYFDTADLMAIGSRETNLDPKWLQKAGDGGHGFGLMQIDIRSFPEFTSSPDWKDARKGIMYGAKVLMQKWHDYEQNIGKRITYKNHTFTAKAASGETAQHIVIAAYNCGRGSQYAYANGIPIDKFTTGHDYGQDVIERAAVIREFLTSSTVKPPGKTADSNDQSAENTDELNSPSMPTAADSPERPKRMSADEQIMPDQSDQEGLTSGSSQEQPPLPAPVLAVPALSPGQTEEKTDTPAQEGTLTKIGNKLNAAYTAVGATIAGMIAWFSSVPGEVVMWIVIGVIALGISYMIINAIRAGIQDMADRRDKRLAADREFELKKMREAHVQEAQMYSMRSVAEKDLTPVTILSPPPTVEMPNSDNQGAS